MLQGVPYILCVHSVALTCFTISFVSREDGIYLFVSLDPNTSTQEICLRQCVNRVNG